MRKFMMAAVSLSALAAAPAVAQTVTGTVFVNGSVAPKCQFTTPSQTIPLGEMAGTDGRLSAAVVNGQTRTLVGWCNATASTMSVEAQPLVNTSFAPAAPTGFDKVVNYTGTAVANAVPGTDTSTTAGAGSPVTVGLFTGNIPVTLSAASTPTGGLLVAGNYSGQVLVTLTPAAALPPA